MRFIVVRFSLWLVAAATFPGEAYSAVYIFSGGNVTIPAVGLGAPYPSTIVVSGIPLAETVVDVNVTVSNFSHEWADDVGAVVVKPGGGQPVILFNAPGDGGPVSGLTWVFDDAAATALPTTTGPLVSGTFRPSNEYTNADFDPPAPARPYSTNLASLNTGNPNGAWSLYVQDFLDDDSGSIGSWSVRIETTVGPRIRINISGNNLVISGANGVPGATNYVLTSTNITLPLSNWTRLATNVFDSSGGFALTNPPAPASPRRFYVLQLP